jgi:hypothetical protein
VPVPAAATDLAPEFLPRLRHRPGGSVVDAGRPAAIALVALATGASIFVPTSHVSILRSRLSPHYRPFGGL